MEYEVHVDRIWLEHVSEFKYLSFVLDKSYTDDVECHRKVVSRRKVADIIRSLVNTKVCNLSVQGLCIRHCLYLFLCMVMRQ